jgi:hypothetical protein
VLETVGLSLIIVTRWESSKEALQKEAEKVGVYERTLGICRLLRSWNKPRLKD